MRILAFAAIAALGTSLLAQGAVVGPCFEPQFGTNLQLSDDSVAQGMPLPFVFPGPGGTVVTTIDISSNGFVWLSPNTDSGCCNGDEGKFLARGPRIAPMWMDFDPSSGGAVWFNTFPAAGAVPARAVITWDQVPEYNGAGPMTFQLQMYDDGSFAMFYDPNCAVFNHPCLTGVTEGNGATANFFDVISTVGNPFDSAANPTAYDINFFFFDQQQNAFTWVPNGQGGYTVAQNTTCSFAEATEFGVGCPKPVTTYEFFQSGTPIDLSNTAIEFFPSGSGSYVATPLPGFFTGYTNMLPFNDDEVQGPFTLPFTFPYTGGSTNAIDISSNGFIWLQSGQGTGSRCCNGDPQTFVSDPASIAVLWQDLYPPGVTGSGGIYFDTVGTTEAHITWVDVPEYFNQGSNTCQLTLRADGSFRLSWGNVANLSHDVLVGLSEGGGSTAAGSTDFSLGTFTTGTGGNPLRLMAQGTSRPSLGATFTMDVAEINPASVLGLMIFGVTAFPGGIDLSFLGMPECALFVSLDATAAFPLAGSPTPYSFGVPNNTALMGTVMNAQAATLTPGANPFGVLASNGLQMLIGY